MYKKILFLLLMILPSMNGFTQTDDASITILDRFSEKATSAPSVSIDFKLQSIDVIEDINNTMEGSVIISKDSYMLTLADNIIWYNGKTSWSYLSAEQEVTITEPDLTDNSFTSRPSMLFSAYKEGYKSRLVEESNNSYIIDLYPNDTQSELIRLRLTLAKSNYHLISFEYKRKDGYSATLIADKYDLTVKSNPDTFEFKPEQYRNVDVIDMR